MAMFFKWVACLLFTNPSAIHICTNLSTSISSMAIYTAIKKTYRTAHKSFLSRKRLRSPGMISNLKCIREAFLFYRWESADLNYVHPIHKALQEPPTRYLPKECLLEQNLKCLKQSLCSPRMGDTTFES